MKKMNSVVSDLFDEQDPNSSEAKIGVDNEIDEQLLLFRSRSIKFTVTERESII